MQSSYYDSEIFITRCQNLWCKSNLFASEKICVKSHDNKWRIIICFVCRRITNLKTYDKRRLKGDNFLLHNKTVRI